MGLRRNSRSRNKFRAKQPFHLRSTNGGEDERPWIRENEGEGWVAGDLIRGRALPDHGMKFPWHEQLAARRFKTFLIETRFALSSFREKKKKKRKEKRKGKIYTEKLRKVPRRYILLLLLFHSINCELIAIFLREWRGNRIINRRIHGKKEKSGRGEPLANEGSGGARVKEFRS